MERSNLVTLSEGPRHTHWRRRGTGMGNTVSSWKMVAMAAASVIALAVAGCATESLRGQEDLTQRIADADTRSEHEELAVWYEQEARAAQERAGYHQRMQQLYEARRDRPARGKLQMDPYADYDPGANARWNAIVELCKSRVRGAEQAAEDYLTLAKVHRQLAAVSKQ